MTDSDTHPIARALGISAGMTTKEVDDVLYAVAERSPGLLVGGYFADVAIVGTYVALTVEDLIDEQRYDATAAAMETLYAPVREGEAA